MLWRRSPDRTQRAPEGIARRDSRSTDFAWRVHGAQEAWTAKVDTKAAIFFALETAFLAAVIAAHSHDRLLGQLTGWRHVFADTGIGFSMVSVFVAGAAVVPLLGRTCEHRQGYRDHLIYFGHLRHWESEALADRLRRLTVEDELRQLGRQLVEQSRRNWTKHRCLQLAMALALLGGTAIVTSVVWPH
jgi:Pycsar effector protein